MKRYLVSGVAGVFGALVLTGGAGQKAQSNSIIIRSSDAQAHMDADTSCGQYYTISYSLPVDLSAGLVDQAILELYVDVHARVRDEILNEAPVLEVYLLKQPFTGVVELQNLDFPSHAVRPVAVGTTRRVLLDITEIVRCHLSRDHANYGLIFGTVTGARDGDLALVSGALGEGIVGRVRLYKRKATEDR